MVKAQVYQKQCETAVCTIVLAKSKLLYLQKKKDNKSSVISDKEGKMPFFVRYSLRPKILVILGFKICPQKQVTLLYLESACACKNQLVPNMDNI